MGANVVTRLFSDSRKLAVFAFIGKTLARSRHHRLVLTAFVAVAIAVVFESFLSLTLSDNFRGMLVRLEPCAKPLSRRRSHFTVPACRFPLLFVYRWNFPPIGVFRVTEPGNRLAFLSAVDEFFSVAPWRQSLSLRCRSKCSCSAQPWGLRQASCVCCRR